MSAAERTAALESLGSALARLGDALAQPKTEWTRDAAIQRFEFTCELAWRAVGRFAKDEGIESGSPRQAIRAAFKLGWIDDDALWLSMLNDRNRTSHTYHEKTAEQIYANLARYHAALSSLVRRLRELGV